MPINPEKKSHLALVIGSGSVKCAAGLGMYKVLQREGIEISLVVGCSGGSLIASAIALDYSAEEIEAMMLSIWKRELMSTMYFRSLLRLALPRLFGFNEHFGLLDDRQIMKRLDEVMGKTTFADTSIPLYLTATEFSSGEKVVLSQGLLRDAIRASIAAPVVFRPWTVDGRLLIDGAMSDPLPVDVAIHEGAEVIMAMGFESPYHEKFSSIMSVVLQMTSISNNNLLRTSFAFYNLMHHAEIIPIVPEFKHRIQFSDTHLIPYIIEEGERATEQHVPYLKRLFGSK